MLWSYNAILLFAILYINLLSKYVSWQAAKKVKILVFLDEKKLKRVGKYFNACCNEF